MGPNSSIEVGIAGVRRPILELLSQYGETLLIQELQLFKLKNQLDFLLVMVVYPNKEEKNDLVRELLIFSDEREAWRMKYQKEVVGLIQFLKHEKHQLMLKEIESGQMENTLVFYFTQGNKNASRKQVQPIVEQYFLSHE
jgi:hypothetical protein